jgi:hypothetical protein
MLYASLKTTELNLNFDENMYNNYEIIFDYIDNTINEFL